MWPRDYADMIFYFVFYFSLFYLFNDIGQSRVVA